MLSGTSDGIAESSCVEACLRDKTPVCIRPLVIGDLDESLAFFRSLPAEDRAYLRRDVTRREIVEERIREIDTGKVRRVVAVVDHRIVADGSLEFENHPWKKHIGEIRLIVARSHQRRGLGILMARHLFGLAAAEKVEEIIVKFMRPQDAARGIFKKLGFDDEIIFPDYVRDQSGIKQDLIIMRCDLEALWRRVEEHITNLDWQRSR